MQEKKLRLMGFEPVTMQVVAWSMMSYQILSNHFTLSWFWE